MEKKADSRADGCAAVNLSASKGAAYNPNKNSLYRVKEQTAFLTSLLGTQLLLTMSATDYPIIKTAEVELEEVS
jgi:hypothetical protein